MYRILFFLLASVFLFVERLRDVEIFSTVIQRTIVDFPAFLEHGSAEKIAVCAHTNRDPNKHEIGFIFE